MRSRPPVPVECSGGRRLRRPADKSRAGHRGQSSLGSSRPAATFSTILTGRCQGHLHRQGSWRDDTRGVVASADVPPPAAALPTRRLATAPHASAWPSTELAQNLGLCSTCLLYT